MADAPAKPVRQSAMPLKNFPDTALISVAKVKPATVSKITMKFFVEHGLMVDVPVYPVRSSVEPRVLIPDTALTSVASLDIAGTLPMDILARTTALFVLCHQRMSW